MIDAPKRAMIPFLTLPAMPILFLVMESVDEDGVFAFFCALPLILLAGIAHALGFLFALSLFIGSLSHIADSRAAIAGAILMMLAAGGNGFFALLVIWMFIR